MSEENKEVQEDSLPEETAQENESNSLFGILFFILAFGAVILLAAKVIFPAMIKGNHSPTSIIEQTQDNEDLHEFFNKFE